jgi:2-methylcitrate dehydratase PrpD
MMPARSLTRQVAEFASALTYADLPAGVVHVAKRLTLDTLGCALAATALNDGCRPVIEVMTRLGGRPESTIVGSTLKVCAPNAAFANGALANALNFDAAGVDVGHTGVASLAAPLALAEARAPVSGRRFLTAVVLAAELTTRMSLASAAVRHTGPERLLLSGQYFGYLPAAAAAGHIVKLQPAAMQSALGLALMQVSGSRQVIVQGDPPAKAIYGGFPSHAGVLGALLAEAGLGAEIDALDGGAGFYALVGGAFDRDLFIDGLGTSFRLLEATFIEAAVEVATRHDVQAAQIASVELLMSPRLRQWCEPVAERRHPGNGASAANSIIFPTVKALAHRTVTLADFTADGLRDDDALALADRTTCSFDERIRGGLVRVRTMAGDDLTAAVETPLGDPSRPISDDFLRAKFRDCCSFVPALSEDDVDALIAFVDRLELAGDVSPLAVPALLHS